MRIVSRVIAFLVALAVALPWLVGFGLALVLTFGISLLRFGQWRLLSLCSAFVVAGHRRARAMAEHAKTDEQRAEVGELCRRWKSARENWFKLRHQLERV